MAKATKVAAPAVKKNVAAFVKEVLAKGVEIYNGDCSDVLPTLPRVDAVVTDPPYGIGGKWTVGKLTNSAPKGSDLWKKTNDEIANRNAWDESAPSKELMDLIGSKGKDLIYWGGNYYDLPPTRCWLIWNKLTREFSLADAEMAWTNMDANVRMWDGARNETGREHPTQKPIKLMEWCVMQLRGTEKVKTILDPFMGSGTTGLAAVNLGHKFIGIEREKRWFELAKKRISASLNQPSLFIDKPGT